MLFKYLTYLVRFVICCLKYGVINDEYIIEFDAQNSGNGISGVQILKIFRGGMPPDPPNYARSVSVPRSGF